MAEIQKLHAAYVRLTGLAVSLDMQGYRESLWHLWMQCGFSEADLAAVVRYVKGCIHNGERGFNLGTLKFNSLIGQPDKFEELKAEAASLARKPEGRNPRAEVLRATGRDDTTGKGECKSAGSVAAALVSDPEKVRAALEELQKLKNSL